jgi:hypothetical protein
MISSRGEGTEDAPEDLSLRKKTKCLPNQTLY